METDKIIYAGLLLVVFLFGVYIGVNLAKITQKETKPVIETKSVSDTLRIVPSVMWAKGTDGKLYQLNLVITNN